ncbi:arpin [Lethenteron reissneri]|uniref:arpin n=1 Tax=Lethenteron reissneri TaxID=7753 RepID=UPI002AB750AC|nr:arpin [Lethenteron reissneri]
MSRIYDNKKLEARPVHSETWPGPWEPSAFEQGSGVLLEGTLGEISRHVMLDSAGAKHRYSVLHVRPERAHRRRWDAGGRELEPNFGETRLVSTGHLFSSYKCEAKGETDRLSESELRRAVAQAKLDSVVGRHGPQGTLPFWVAEDDMDKTELELGDRIRIKTRGDSPFVFSLARVDAGTVTRCNFAGDAAAGASWTDKILGVKSGLDAPPPGAGGDGEGAADDEWD